MSVFSRKSRKPRPCRAPGAAAGAPPPPSPIPRCLCIPMQGQQNPIAVVAAAPLQQEKGTTPERPQAGLWCRASTQWPWPDAAGPGLPGPLRAPSARPGWPCPEPNRAGPGAGARTGLWGPSAGPGLLPARLRCSRCAQRLPRLGGFKQAAPSSNRSHPSSIIRLVGSCCCRGGGRSEQCMGAVIPVSANTALGNNWIIHVKEPRDAGGSIVCVCVWLTDGETGKSLRLCLAAALHGSKGTLAFEVWEGTGAGVWEFT